MGIQLLPLKDMNLRHPSLPDYLEECYKRSAAVVLDRHHKPPQEFRLKDDDSECQVLVEWDEPDERTEAAFANTIDAAEAGAYAYALAAIELKKGMIAVRRMETLTGADYYIAPIGSALNDLENAYKLEVSGTEGSESTVKGRIKFKVEQAKKGTCNLPALATVVGFAVKLIWIKAVEN